MGRKNKLQKFEDLKSMDNVLEFPENIKGNWNEKVFKEDLPIKIRRQKMIDLNFKDFKGLPLDISQRANGKYTFKLPIPRIVSSKRDEHPLNFKKINNKE